MVWPAGEKGRRLFPLFPALILWHSDRAEVSACCVLDWCCNPCAFAPEGLGIVPDQPDCVLEVGVVQLLFGEVDGPGTCEDCGYGHPCCESGEVPFGPPGMGLDAGRDLSQSPICGLGVGGCVLQLRGEIGGLPCGVMVDLDGAGEQPDLLAEEIVDVIADMFAEGFGAEGAAGGRDPRRPPPLSLLLLQLPNPPRFPSAAAPVYDWGMILRLHTFLAGCLTLLLAALLAFAPVGAKPASGDIRFLSQSRQGIRPISNWPHRGILTTSPMSRRSVVMPQREEFGTLTLSLDQLTKQRVFL